MIVAIMNQKDDIGKMTTAVNLSAAMAVRGRRSLLVDLDAQASLSQSLGIQPSGLTAYDLLKGLATATEATIRLKDFDLIPPSPKLADAEQELANLPDWELILRTALEPTAENYAFVYINCPPGMGFLTINALVAASRLYVPIQPEFYSLDELKSLLDTAEFIKKKFNPTLEIAGIIVTRHDHMKQAYIEIENLLKQNYNGILFKQSIRENTGSQASPSFGQDVLTNKPDSEGSNDYLALADEILMREG